MTTTRKGEKLPALPPTRGRVRRFVAQGYTGWPYSRDGGRVKTEDDPFDPNPPGAGEAPDGSTL